MEKLVVRKISIHDIDQLQKIGKESFVESFAAVNTKENMKTYLAKAFANEKLKTELTDVNSEFYFVEHEGQTIGYLKINFGSAQTDLQNENALEIERIYVLKAYHGKKVGQLLFEKAIDVAIRKKVDYMWLGVWEENPRAIRFYQKNGFVEFDKHPFVLGSEEQIDILMKLTLENKKE